MKRNFLAVAILALAINAPAFAGDHNGVEGGAVVGIGATGFVGTVTGSASSISTGNAVTAAQVGGNGGSFQSANGSTGGTATIGGGVNNVGATVVTSTTQYSNSAVTGSTFGNAPTMSGTSIANGGAAYGNTNTAAQGGATFATESIGAVAGIGGVAGISFNH